MKLRLTTSTRLTAALCLLVFTGCDAMVDEEEFRARIDAECREGFAEGSEENAEIFCDCQTAAIRERDMSVLEIMDDELMSDISEVCRHRVMENMRKSLNI